MVGGYGGQAAFEDYGALSFILRIPELLNPAAT